MPFNKKLPHGPRERLELLMRFQMHPGTDAIQKYISAVLSLLSVAAYSALHSTFPLSGCRLPGPEGTPTTPI